MFRPRVNLWEVCSSTFLCLYLIPGHKLPTTNTYIPFIQIRLAATQRRNVTNIQTFVFIILVGYNTNIGCVVHNQTPPRCLTSSIATTVSHSLYIAAYTLGAFLSPRPSDLPLPRSPLCMRSMKLRKGAPLMCRPTCIHIFSRQEWMKTSFVPSRIITFPIVIRALAMLDLLATSKAFPFDIHFTEQRCDL